MGEEQSEAQLAMKTIWKFPLAVQDRQDIQVPEGASFLSVKTQNGSLCLWAIVDPSQPKQRRTIEILGTGHKLDESEREYIGTAIMADGALVWHIFERL